MFKKTLMLIVSIVIFLLLSLYFLQNNESNKYLKEGKILIEKIETFRKTNKRLPNNLTEIGINEPMKEGPYYEKKDSLNYIVFFNIGFDNAKIYYSDKKIWKFEH